MKDHIIYNFIYIKCPKQADIETESRVERFVDTERKQKWENISWYRISVWSDGKVSEMDNVGGCTAL